ncbi:glucokinase [Desulfovibrio sp. OttesenSCG-928-M16]|nr:glucokinase [Desulfovibrio sp. OttesenSCG-928-M16]
MQQILAADIGATNSRFALFNANTKGDAPLLTLKRERWLKGADYATFADALRELTNPASDQPLPDPKEPAPIIAVIAPAGPILGEAGRQTCRISNLTWTIDAQESAALLGIERVCMINDFVAQAHACLLPEAALPVPLLEGQALDGAPKAVVGAGTGFGKALLLGTEATPGESGPERLQRLARSKILPSEGGHSEFPFVGREEADFAAFAARREGTQRLIFDSIVSGKGLAHVFAWAGKQDLHPHQASALAPDEPEVMALYARFYARACRVYVLETLALGGLYITGGMALRVPVLEHPAFAAEFYASTAQESLLRKVPVYHVKNDRAGLWGAALHGLLQTL